ncbi:presqualene diphosphate synthase HpnD [Asanoa sp. NPDC049518]|uniref:presqualene diphosphate synthase HpnD n=1 Tax=unclassified Asanoa TaxID=2685164 RepID=UPI00343F302E
MTALSTAYETCEAITRTEARNFYYGIRLLPPAKRTSLCAVYALARRIDDIGDGDLALADKTTALHGLKAELSDIDGSTDPVLVAVADTARRFPLPVGAFGELVDGVQMDLNGTRYDTFEQLVDYCRCVAGSVGRLCLGIFGSRADPRASEYADALGIALQQVNILRDIREDLTNNRVYLPSEDLHRFGVRLALDAKGNLVDRDGGLARFIAFAAERARLWYERGLRLLPLLDRRSAASAAAMSGIYRRLLEQIATNPRLVYDRRLSLTGWQKASVAVRALAGVSS